MRNGVLVVGSVNVDLVMQVKQFPRSGETIKGEAFHVVGGGKGANQAVAAARLGADVTFVGAVGDDDYGRRMLETLQEENIDTEFVRRIPGTATGTALIIVDAQGNNQIVIAPGANDRIGIEHLEEVFASGIDASVCLLQLETPMEIVVRAAELARRAGMTVVLDPAPAAPLPAELQRNVHVITPNETETTVLTGLNVTDTASAAEAARVLLGTGIDAAVIKMGERGALLVDGSQEYFRPAYSVQAVDTTAAGDAFNGGLGVALSRGASLRDAIDYAAAVGALAVTRVGAMPSLPMADEVKTFERRS